MTTTTAGAGLRSSRSAGLSRRDAGALFAAVVVAGVAWLAPGAGPDRVASQAGGLLPSDVVNVALRQAAVELQAIGATDSEAQGDALGGVPAPAEVTLTIARAGEQPCVEAVHSSAIGQVWSYDAATGAIATQPC